MTDVINLSISNWNQPCSVADQERAIGALERGNVLLFPQLRLPILDGEDRILVSTSVERSKNISLDPATGKVRGSNADEVDLRLLQSLMMRFANSSRELLRNLFPRYESGVQQARTSFRPVEVAGRPSSWRKDDTRLHVDSFPSSPTQGKRILRVFTNINPVGQNRRWRLGESFESVANRYAQKLPNPLWGSSTVLNALGITKARRSDYDHFMLLMHDQMKADADYQANSVQSVAEFSPGCTWMVFTDQVPHAATSGKCALEQTYLLPIGNMLEPAQSPLRVLERVLGRALVG